MTDRDAQDYAERAYEQYREALVKVFPPLAETLPLKYEDLRPNERKVWDAVGVWVTGQVYDAVEDERSDWEHATRFSRV